MDIAVPTMATQQRKQGDGSFMSEPDNDEAALAPAKTHKTKRYRGVRPLAKSLSPLTGRAFGRRGFAQGAIVRDWPAIVGPLLADHTLPERILYPKGKRGDGTLTLRVENPGFALEVQHFTPVLIERINGYFGYRAVKDLHVNQAPLPRKKANEAERRTLTPAEEVALAEELETIADADLKAALSGLGRAIRTRGGGTK